MSDTLTKIRAEIEALDIEEVDTRWRFRREILSIIDKHNTREDKYMPKLMEQTHRLATIQKKLTHGELVSSSHVLSVIAHYRELADILEIVYRDKLAAEDAIKKMEGKQ